MPRIIGLTGGIGSGKSTVARILAGLGAQVVDADKVGHEVYAPGSDGWRRVTERFGASVVAADGSIDRRKLGAIVFGDAAALADLNAIVHPLIGMEIARRVRSWQESGAELPLVLEAALLVEAGWTGFVDQVWVVRAAVDSVVDRVRSERGMAEEDTRARIRTQLGDEQRCAAADVIIDNDGSLTQLEERVREAWRTQALA
jgi:dephospho-CoA kinase